MVLSSISRTLGSDLSCAKPLRKSENEEAIANQNGQRGTYQNLEGLRETQISAYLEEEMARGSVVEGFAFTTHALNDLFNSEIELRNGFDKTNVGVSIRGLSEGSLE